MTSQQEDARVAPQTSTRIQSKHQSKRKLSEQGSKCVTAATQGQQRQASIVDIFSKAHPSAQKAAVDDGKLPSSKRFKGTPPPAQPSNTMSLGFIFRSENVGDPNRASNFQPHTGAKRLVIKNLRTTPRNDSLVYYEQTWKHLEDALTSIFRNEVLKQPLERLYRGAEDICKAGQAENLFIRLRDRMSSYLFGDVLRAIDNRPGMTPDVEVLRSVLSYWKLWSDQTILIRSIFSYLDCSYLLNSKAHPRLNDLAIDLFYKMAFSIDRSRRTTTGVPEIGKSILQGICDLIMHDRAGHDQLFEPLLLKEAVSMLHIIGSGEETRFQKLLIKESEAFFRKSSENIIDRSLSSYIFTCDQLVQKESLRCDQYNLGGSIKQDILKLAQRYLVQERLAKLTNVAEVSKLLEEGSIAPLKALYGLLKASQLQLDLRKPWEQYITSTGSVIVRDKERGDEMVLRLLELKRSLDRTIRDAFNKDEAFTYTLREAFGHFINDRKNTAVWGTFKVGEMIAKYIDLLLRGGVKAVPSSLISDVQDRNASERLGIASTGDEDAELDRQLDNGLELFRFIEGKDVFEAFYKKDLARRLLMSRSASQDAERNMLAKLKTECGSSFTHNLETMFKDQELAKDEMASFKQIMSAREEQGIDLSVSVLSASAWPTYPDVEIQLPSTISQAIQRFEQYYGSKHTGRKLSWKHSLGHCTLKARFNKGVKELVLSSFQAVVLLLFNDLPSGEKLSYEDIIKATGLVDAELRRTLQSLACGKTRVLTKHPKGRDVNTTDEFTVNVTFTDPKFRIKINTIQLKETKEEVQETHERVAQDRQYETQAAIVRIMKSRKTMTHAALVAEVIDQTKSRGAVEPAEIKKNIEKLIEKDYIERESGAYVYLA